ncbi:MAG TPA: ElyC/SanA/YdcF family protein [Chthoniobacterales bacterium]|jgi:hypothetical protein|nr:ElyC/SanA/YdcF family protein [Chthoniobacterales bacterium]
MQQIIPRDQSVDSSARLPQARWGLFTRKERWGLSWRGWLLITSVGLIGVYLVFLNVHPFLAVSHRVNTNVLVVEGSIQRYTIRAGAEEFKNGSYERIFTTGGPWVGEGGYTNDYNTSASVAAEALKKFGVPDDLVQMVPSRVIDRERTYSSAVALRDWFREHNTPVHSINVLTEGPHARRTRLLYQKAFGKNMAVGIIAVSNPDYDPTQWWRYSDGVREVIGESIAYIYARFFFYPSVSSSDKEAAQAAPTSR